MNIEPAEMFKGLCVKTRLNIIHLLHSKGPLGATDIAKQLGLTPAAVSQHLKILKQLDLVRSQRKGFWIPYSINEEAMEHCAQSLTSVCKGECHETGKPKRTSPVDSSMISLKKQEQRLMNELAQIRKKIRKIESAI